MLEEFAPRAANMYSPESRDASTNRGSFPRQPYRSGQC